MASTTWSSAQALVARCHLPKRLVSEFPMWVDVGDPVNKRPPGTGQPHPENPAWNDLLKVSNLRTDGGGGAEMINLLVRNQIPPTVRSSLRWAAHPVHHVLRGVLPEEQPRGAEEVRAGQRQRLHPVAGGRAHRERVCQASAPHPVSLPSLPGWGVRTGVSTRCGQ